MPDYRCFWLRLLKNYFDGFGTKDLFAHSLFWVTMILWALAPDSFVPPRSWITEFFNSLGYERTFSRFLVI